MNKQFIENKTIKDISDISFSKFSDNDFLCSPSNKSNTKVRNYSYSDVKNLLLKYTSYFKSLNLKHSERVSVIVGNIPEYFIIKLSLNYIGLSCVPLNNELTLDEIAFIVKHSESKLIIANNMHINNIKKIILKIKKKVGLSLFEKNTITTVIKIKRNNLYKNTKITPSDEASLLYTSGTTGKPKACILSHFYEINSGYSYAIKKGFISIKREKERLYNCLPVHHVNSGVLSFYAILITGNCQIQSKRFSAKSFWEEIKYSKATIFHYLGVIVSILLKQKYKEIEINNCLRLGVGAGIEPSLHNKFEKRFNIPMIELWGMTEMVRCIYDHRKSRVIGKRRFGKADTTLEVKIINNEGKAVINKEGELLIRYSKANPKKGFFSGYYKNKKATEEVWKNNWFHTGDVVIKDQKDYLYFVDRKKNIIRRAGENISAAEVEAALLALEIVKNCAVIAFPHEIYEEEVLAFIVVKGSKNFGKVKAQNILNLLIKKISYYKLPGYIQFTNSIPITSTQKIVKSELLKKIKLEDKSRLFDLCDYKKLLKTN